MSKMKEYYIENNLKECEECYGTGEIPDSYHDKTGKGDICPECNGTGTTFYTDDDALIDKEDENISNKGMMDDD